MIKIDTEERRRSLNGGTEETQDALNRIPGMTVNFQLRHLKNARYKCYSLSQPGVREHQTVSGGKNGKKRNHSVTITWHCTLIRTGHNGTHVPRLFDRLGTRALSKTGNRRNAEPSLYFSLQMHFGRREKVNNALCITSVHRLNEKMAPSRLREKAEVVET
jgi:hypothetical protein